MKKWGQAPRVGMIFPVVRIGRRSQSPFFHKFGAMGDTAVAGARMPHLSARAKACHPPRFTNPAIFSSARGPIVRNQPGCNKIIPAQEID